MHKESAEKSGNMIQKMKVLPCKHEDMCSDHQKSCEKLGKAVCTAVIPALGSRGGQQQEDLLSRESTNQ